MDKVCREQEEQILNVLDIVNSNANPNVTQDNQTYETINHGFLVYLEEVLEAYNSVGTQSIIMNAAGQSVFDKTRKTNLSKGGPIYSDNGTIVMERSLISATPS